jgi:hypothetical protein
MRARRLARALAASLIVHGAVVGLWFAWPRPPARTDREDTEPVALEVVTEDEPPARALTPEPAPLTLTRSRGGARAPATVPAPPRSSAAAPLAPASPPSGFARPQLWRSDETQPRLTLRAAPATPETNDLERLFQPAPNVLHHPTTPTPLGTHRTPAGVEARVRPDGSIRFRDPPPATVGVQGLGIGGTFDLNDLAFRAAGVDPYRTQKQRLADETREDRICLANEDRLDRKRIALGQLRQQLDAIVRRPEGDAQSWEERRRLVFELWDDCVEGGSEAERALAAAFRAAIIGYVRRELPQGSPHAFTPEELATLNRRRSTRERFDPYAAAAERDAGAEAPPS